jgi:hypothetical protein
MRQHLIDAGAQGLRDMDIRGLILIARLGPESRPQKTYACQTHDNARSRQAEPT